jgi:hypothetical protein
MFEMSRRPKFLALVSDGYTLRNCMSIIQSEVTQATLYLTPDQMVMSCTNKQNYAIHHVAIDTRELQSYVYTFEDENGVLLPSASVSFNTEEMFKAMKGIGKRDPIRIYWLEGDPRMSIEPIKNASKSTGQGAAVFVSVVNGEMVRYEMPDFKDQEPNVRVNAKVFSDMCMLAGTTKCTHVEMICKKSSISFQGVSSDGNIGFVEPISAGCSRVIGRAAFDAFRGNPDQSQSSDEEEPIKFKIPISTIKAVSKIHNISPPGTMLRVFYQRDVPLSVVSPIGIYGTYTLGLKDSSNN